MKYKNDQLKIAQITRDDIMLKNKLKKFEYLSKKYNK